MQFLKLKELMPSYELHKSKKISPKDQNNFYPYFTHYLQVKYSHGISAPNHNIASINKRENV